MTETTFDGLPVAGNALFHALWVEFISYAGQETFKQCGKMNC